MTHRIPHRLGVDLVGRRVVVRRRLSDGAPGHRFGDLLGDLLAWDEPAGVARVRTRHGDVEVLIADVVAGKPVPPPPRRRPAAHRTIGWAQLERLAAAGWRPLDLDWLGEPGSGWQLRAAEGFTGRANSALAVGDPGVEVATAAELVDTWYRRRRLRPRIAVPWPASAVMLPDRARDHGPDRELRDRGWQLDTPTLVMTAALHEVAASVTTRSGSLPSHSLTLHIDDEPDDAWCRLYQYRDQALPSVARTLLLSAPRQAFVSVRAPDRTRELARTHVAAHLPDRDTAAGDWPTPASGTVAVARVASAHGWSGITAMHVAPSHRRRGLAQAVIGAAAEWALARGDRYAYLQVAERNAAARALYHSVGFADHHGYHYRLAPRTSVTHEHR
ncbi:MAG: GNAT family N-acetyltransferase [Angustibacter sp.]